MKSVIFKQEKFGVGALVSNN